MAENKPWQWRRNPWWGPLPIGFIFTVVVLVTIMVVGYSSEW